MCEALGSIPAPKKTQKTKKNLKNKSTLSLPAQATCTPFVFPFLTFHKLPLR
jgi:hypothetical protein